MAVQRLGDVAVGTVVKLNEGGKPVNYIVVQQGSPSSDYYGFENVTTVQREGIHSNRQWNSSDDDRYAISSIDAWAQGDFFNSLDEDIRVNVITVRIPYAKDYYGRNVQTGSNGLQCKAFVLSLNEMNLNGETVIGSVFSYYKGASNSKRIAKLNGSASIYWTRSPYHNYALPYSHVSAIANDGGIITSIDVQDWEGARPALPLNSDLFVLADGTVTANQPPTAPGSIAVSGVVRGQTAAITLTAATDPDGMVASYIFERQVDGGAWQQVAQVNSLTQIDPVSEDWGSVAYRACAVDDLGLQGPYITGETYTVNSGWVTIGGPAEDMGSQPKSFDFDFTVSVSGAPTVDAITVSAALDGAQIYSGTPSAGEQISVPVDTRLLGAGEHVIEVQASKDDYLPASKRYTFTIPAVTIPAGGTGEQAQGSDGRPVFHTTLAQRCIGTDGVDIQAQVDALTARVKTLEG